MVKPANKKMIAEYMIREYSMSIRQACQALQMNRSTFYYKKVTNSDEQIEIVLHEFAHQHPTYGFWKMYKTIRRKGLNWNHKRVYRVYTNLKMNLRRKAKRRLPERIKQPLHIPEQANQMWSLDFMTDVLQDKRRFRILNIIDDYNRQALAMLADTSITTARLIHTLDYLIQENGRPQQIRTDNGPEFISQTLNNWCNKHNVEHIFIQPGKPTQNAFIERFNGSFRREILDAYIFTTLSEVRLMINEWMLHYNTERPHDALNNLTPKEFLLNQNKQPIFNLS